MNGKCFFRNYRLPLLLLAGISVGSLIGVVYGPGASALKPLGDIFINLMFTIVVPMVFVSITSAVGNMADLKRLRRILGSLFFVFIATGVVAGVLVLFVVKTWPPVASAVIPLTSPEIVSPKTFGDLLVESLTVSDFYGLFCRDNMLPIIVFSVMTGIAVAATGGRESPVGMLLNNANEVIMTMIGYIMKVAPVGLGAYFASLVGEFGPELIGDYGRTLLIYYPMCLFYLIVFFPVYAWLAGGMRGVRAMCSHIFNPLVTAFATQSSVATIPANMDACGCIGVPEDISDIVLPMGATMHMDGSVLSAIVKISFLFGVFNMPFTGSMVYAKSMVIAVLSAFVLSGAPGGGLVGEMLIVSLFGFPPEAFPLIATIGFLVDPPATSLNAGGDTVASMLVARVVEGKGWMRNGS